MDTQNPRSKSFRRAPEDEPVCRLESLEGQLAALTAERDQLAAEKAELKDRLLRARAEFDNARRRAERERSEFLQFAAMDLVRDILPMLDDFERALKVETADRDYAKGVELIYQRLFETLKKLGLEPIETAGQQFDPNLHQAVERVETEEAEDQAILGEFQRGYNFKGKLLGPPWSGSRSGRKRSESRVKERLLRSSRCRQGSRRSGNQGRLPQAGPAATIPTAIRTIPTPKRNSRKRREAYSVLSDAQKRAAYDRFGHAGLQGAAARPVSIPEAFADFSDILGDFFGFGDLFGGGRRPAAHAARSAAKTCATTWRSLSKRRCSA